MEELTKTIRIYPARDKRHADPDKDYGIHSAELACYLSGPLGAIQFVLHTQWYLPKNRHGIMQIEKYPFEYWQKPMGADVGCHSKKPLYDDQSRLTDSCEWTDNQPCYYDGSGLLAHDYFEVLVKEGLDGLWAKLEERYADWLRGGLTV